MSAAEPRFFVIGGTLPASALSYVPRCADQQLYEAIVAREFSYVLDARQMGKSSLMVRTALRLRAEGKSVVVLDLTALGTNVTVEQWYDGLLSQMGRRLGLEDVLEDFWQKHARLSPLQRWFGALREVARTHGTGELVLFIDEIDVVRSLPFSTDEFFAAIRQCYNLRTQDPAMERVTFCLLGVATPASLIRATQMTPFNIGRRVELSDFTEAEAGPLVEGLQREKSTGQRLMARILYWTGGHPYLTQRLCRAVAEDPGITTPQAVDRLCAALFLSRRGADHEDNLLFVRERLLKSDDDVAGVLDLYGKVLAGRPIENNPTRPHVATLLLSGVVRVKGECLTVRNRIYRTVFSPAWIRDHLPGAERQRQRSAYRRGLLRASSLAAALVVVLGTLTVIAITSAQRAQKSRLYADRRTREAQAYSSALTRALGRATALKAKADAAARDALREKRAAHRAEQVAQARRTEAELQKRAALARTRESQERSGQLMVAYGAHLQDEGDLYGSLLWYAQAALTDVGDPGRRATHLLRLAATLQRAPRLIRLRSSIAYPPPPERALSPNRDRRLHSLLGGGAFVMDAKTKKQLTPLLTHGEEIHQMAFSPDGQRVATGSADRTVRVWDAQTGVPLTPFLKLRFSLLALAFSPDSRWIVTASEDGTVRLWDASTGASLSPPLRHGAPVRSVAFNPSGTELTTIDDTRVERTWDLVGLEGPDAYIGEFGNVAAAEFSPDGRLLATGDFDWGARIWDVATGLPVSPLLAHAGAVRSVTFSADGRLLATGSDDLNARIWDVRTGKLLATLPHENKQKGAWNRVLWLAFSPDGTRLLTAGEEGCEPLLWEVRTGHLVRTLRGHTQRLRRLTFSLDSQRVATASADGTVRIWDAVHGAQIQALTLGSQASDVRFLKGGRWVVTGSTEGTITLRDAMTGHLVLPSIQSEWLLNSVTVSPDERLLLSAGHLGDTQLWDLRTGRVSGLPLRHQNGITAAVFSPNGRFIATASRDHTARIWDTASQSPITPPLEHSSTVRKVIFSPTNGSCLTLCDDGAARLWRLPTALPEPDSVVRLVEVLASRQLDAHGGTRVMGPDQLDAAWRSVPAAVRASLGPSTGQRYAWQLARAAEDFARENWSQALTRLDPLLRDRPGDRQIRSLRMVARAHLGKWEAVRADRIALAAPPAWLLVTESHRPLRLQGGALTSEANHKVLVLLPGPARRLTVVGRALGAGAGYQGTFRVRVADRVAFRAPVTPDGAAAEVALHGAGAFFLEYEHQGPDAPVAWQHAQVVLEDGRTIPLAELPCRTIVGL